MHVVESHARPHLHFVTSRETYDALIAAIPPAEPEPVGRLALQASISGAPIYIDQCPHGCSAQATDGALVSSPRLEQHVRG